MAVVINKIRPDKVKVGWEGTVNLIGEGFDSGSTVFVNWQGGGNTPETLFKNATLLEACFTKEITATLGSRIVTVHTGDGELSNEVNLMVLN